MARSSLVALVLAAALAGCDSDDDQAATRARPLAARPGSCTAARTAGFRLCQRDEAPGRWFATIERRDPDGWSVVVGAPPRLHRSQVGLYGFWRQAWLSPDGETLLAQWSGECEVPIAFFVNARDGSMRPVTGERDWTDAPESVALGWNAAGRARVRLLKGECGSGYKRPGVYLVEPGTHRLTRAVG